MADFSKQEDQFFDELQGRFILFGNPEHAGSKSTYWMQMNMINGTDIAGGRTSESTAMTRALDVVLEKIVSQEFIVYQTKEALDAAIVKNEKKKGHAGADEEDDSLADDRLEQGEDDANDLRSERAFFHDEKPLDVSDSTVASADTVDQVVGQSRNAVRADDVALDMFEKFSNTNHKTPVVETSQEVVAEVREQPEEQSAAEVVQESSQQKVSEEKEDAAPAPDIFEQFGVSEEHDDDLDAQGHHIHKERHIVPEVETIVVADKDPEQKTSHKVKVPQTDTEQTPQPQHVRAQPQQKSAQAQTRLQLPLLEAVAQFWHESKHTHVTDADAFTADMRLFGDMYFEHFVDEKKRTMYAWQALRSDVPESFQMSTLFTQFNQKYGEEALVAYLGSLPNQG